MIPALSFESMEEEVKNSFESIPNTIVGIMYARYDIDLVKKTIETCYQYWNTDSNKYFNIFWIGYGAYIFEGSKEIECLKGGCERYGIHFDLQKFGEFKNIIESRYGIEYKDNFEVIIVESTFGILKFENYLRINLEVEDKNLRSIIQTIINCGKNNTNLEATKEILQEKFEYISLAK